MDHKVLSLGRTSPVLADTSSPIKAIRVNRDAGKDGTSLASGWSNSWNEGSDFEKTRNVSQRKRLGLLVSEKDKLAGERDAALKGVELEKKKREELAGEVERLREVNSLFLNRIRQIKEETKVDSTEQKSTRGRHEQEIASLKKKVKLLMGDLESQQQQHVKARKEWDAQLAGVKSQNEALKLENKSKAEALEAARCKQESDAAIREHVIVMMVVAGEVQGQTDFGEAQLQEAQNVTNVVPDPTSVDGEITETCDKLLEAIPEFGTCETPQHSEKEAPVTPPISPPGKPSQLDGADFDRPIPLHMSWADMVEDDARWYEDSESEAEKLPAVSIKSTAVLDTETRAVEDVTKTPAVEPIEEQGWLSRKGHGEFRAFRAFNHYRASSFDNSSKRVSKRSPRKSHTHHQQASHNGPAKHVSQTPPRHQRHKSMEKVVGGQSGDDSGPWPEWNAGTPRNYSNVQKVGSGVLVVNRKAPKSNAPVSAPTRRSKSDIPPCRRHLAGYCKFEDQCWFRHD